MAVFLIATQLVWAAQTDSLERAWTEAAKGNRTGAIEIARRLTQAESGNADAHLLLGSLLMEDGDQAGSINELQESVRLNPNSADGWNALGEAYKTFARAKEARAPFERAIQLNPELGIAHMNLGAVLLQTGEFAQAAEQLDIALPLLGDARDAAEARYLRAKIFNAMGQSDGAWKQLEEAVRLAPGLAAAWSDLGEARRLTSNGSALAAYQRAVELNPKDAVAQYRLGAELLRHEQVAAASDHLEIAYRLAPEDQSTLNALQSAYRLGGRAADAARVKQELAAVLKARDLKSQNNLTALKLNNQGAELQKKGEMAGAADKYREALSLQPEHNGIRLNYAVALLRTGRWAEGLEQLHEALQREPGNRDIEFALKEAVAQAPHAMLPEWAKTVH